MDMAIVVAAIIAAFAAIIVSVIELKATLISLNRQYVK